MITKEIAVKLGNWQSDLPTTELHYTGKHDCVRTIGPRGGIKEFVTLCRPSGKCHTWVTRPTEFKLPVKHGMYDNSYITQDNAADFHLASDCPLNQDASNASI